MKNEGQDAPRDTCSNNWRRSTDRYKPRESICFLLLFWVGMYKMMKQGRPHQPSLWRAGRVNHFTIKLYGVRYPIA